jgi:NAD(P)-dependent dehydrogenase (short-subunit alcohol dehydrogenase family)
LTARRQAELNEVVEECNTIRKGSAFGVPLDMSVRAMNQRAVDATLHEYGRLDVLILNAGVSAGAPVEQVNEDGLDAFEALTKTNYFGPVYATKYALPELLRNHGRIVVISSVFGIHGGPGRAFYAGSKFALHGFFESLRYEIASRDVKITMVCPGPVATDIARARVGPDGKRAVTGHFDIKKAISADSAAERIIQALERGERLRTFSTGISLLHRFQNFCPAFWDWIFLRGMRKLGMLDHIGVQP